MRRRSLTVLAALVGVVVAAGGALTAIRLLREDRPSAEERVLRGFDASGNANEQFGSLNDLVLDKPAAAGEAAIRVIGSPSKPDRFAAVYVLGLLADRPEERMALASALDDGDAEIRVIAAGSLVGLGHREAIPVLIEFLGEDRTILRSDPPQSFAAFAFEALRAYTGRTFGWPASVTPGDRDASRDRWRRWWNEEGATLRWDAEGRVYR